VSRRPLRAASDPAKSIRNTRRSVFSARYQGGHRDEAAAGGEGASLVDIDRLEALLIEAARERRSLTYAEVLLHFGIRITPRRVYALCRDLGQVCERNRARGEPDLAVLVVRKADRLPGEGFFHGLWRDGAYDGPATGPAAEAYIRAQTEEVFAHWAGSGAGEI
jgi:hypothetical protein